MADVRISVAMATFNGARWLRQQLDSIAAQSRLPDELVVRDDGSTDATLDVLRAFAGAAPFPVRVRRGAVRLGYSGNFDAAIRACTGDIVLVSDQDDVWLPRKVEVVAARFDAPAARPWVVLNDQWVADADLHAAGITIFGETRRLGFGEETLGAGSCSALSAAFVRLCFPMPVPDAPYDSWIHRVAVPLGIRTLIDEPLQYYRRHGANASRPLVLRGGRSGRGILFREYGLAGMGARHDLECRILVALAGVAHRAAKSGAVAETVALPVADRAMAAASLIRARMEINGRPRCGRIGSILATRRAFGPAYALASMCKDGLRRRAPGPR